MTKIILTNITDAMKKSYLDYAMSVIVARALPDVRDGLKPVQRRIIYDMHKLGLGSSAKYSKSAKVVGDVLGKYHPHSDAPVYEALVRMAQDFSLRYTLIKGQGNFGSVDGDPAAAMRYTEVKLNKITDELLQDLEKDTVVWRKNFDGSLEEPDYLPSKLPNLLLNGAEGIAVGMATKIPSQNISELIEALQFMLDTPTYDKKLSIEEAAHLVSFQVTVDDLMKFVKGPDFPTGGIIYSHTDIKEAYTTGRNSIIMRGVAEIEDIGKGKQAIIITELPYQVNKATLVQRIAELVQDKKIAGISDLRDESDREGIRVVVELKREASANKILNNLFQKTQLQTSFPVNMVTLVDGIPQTLSLKEILEYFLRHRAVVVIKRTKYDLRVAKDRAHILDGLLIAIDNIDEIVDIIKKSKSEDDARDKLIKRFKFSPVQTKAILDMQLKRLTALERDKILDELKALKKEIARLEEILSSLKNVFTEMKKELAELLIAYGDKRKTKVVRSRPDEFSE
ncbi:MAG: DNA topoisomerase (ATP-hydrolyzing) [Patescibacteria group bacterium]